MWLRWAEVVVEGARLGPLIRGDRQLLDRYQRWRSLDALSVAFATDSRDAYIRRAGQGGVRRASLRHGAGRPHFGRFPAIGLMNEARGTSGESAAAIYAAFRSK